MRMYDAQNKYAFLRSFMYAKGMFEVIDEDTVKVDIHTRSSLRELSVSAVIRSKKTNRSLLNLTIREIRSPC